MAERANGYSVYSVSGEAYVQEIEHILVPAGPVPVGPFSHAVRFGRLMFVTGQMPTSPEGEPTIVDGGIEVQTRRVMDNLRLILSSQNVDFGGVLMARVFLLDFQRDYALMNSVYESYFESTRRPARTCVGVTGLALNALVEIDLVVAC